jgi:hypothetical protein
MTQDTEFTVGDEVYVTIAESDPFHAKYNHKRGRILSVTDEDFHFSGTTGYMVRFSDGFTFRMAKEELQRTPERVFVTPVEPPAPKDPHYVITLGEASFEELQRILARHAWESSVSDPLRIAVINAVPVSS